MHDDKDVGCSHVMNHVGLINKLNCILSSLGPSSLHVHHHQCFVIYRYSTTSVIRTSGYKIMLEIVGGAGNNSFRARKAILISKITLKLAVMDYFWKS